MTTHKDKIRIAKQLQTPLERSRTARDSEGKLTHEPIFQTAGWELRKAEIAARVARRVRVSQAKAAARRAAAQPKVVPIWRQNLNARIQAYRNNRAAKRAAYKAKHAQV